MQKRGLGDALAAGIDRSLLCSFKKLIVLSSEFLIHVPRNDSGHKQQDSQHVSTFGVLFPLLSALISFPRMLCLWKAQHDILRDFYLLCLTDSVWVAAEKQKLPQRIHQDYQQEGRTTSGLKFWPILIYGKTPTEVSIARISPLSQQFWVPAHSALELPASTIRVLRVPRAFVLCTAGRSHETLHISKQIPIKQLGNLRHCWTVRDSNLHPEAWCFTLAQHSKTNLILTNFLSFTKTCL